MPCYRCGARQTDPARGPSPWKRGVIGGHQVLACPECQRVHDWVGDLDRCLSCGSTMLVRALGETTCRSCGAGQLAEGAGPVAAGEAGRVRPGSPPTGPPGGDRSLADEVSAAIDRLLRGSGTRQGG